MAAAQPRRLGSCRSAYSASRTVAAANSTPSGRVSADNAAPALASASQRGSHCRPSSSAPTTQRVVQKTKSAVSRPELVQVRNVRLVTAYTSTATANQNRHGCQDSGSGTRQTSRNASASDPYENSSETRLAVCGGSNPVMVQIPCRRTIQRKFE